MKGKIGINIIIEREKQGNKTIFIASSPDINVFAEGKTIDEAQNKFVKAVKFHLKNFPEDKELLTKKEECEMPLITRMFL